jgi:hypothetical protein
MAKPTWKVSILALLTMFVLCTPAESNAQRPGDGEWLTGMLLLSWGDPRPGGAVARAPMVASLMLPDGSSFRLDLTEGMIEAVGGPTAAFGRRIQVLVDRGAALTGDGAVRPWAVRVVGTDGSQPDVVSGSQPWVSIMCKFSDVPGEPADLSFFRGMYANTWPGLDHYWRSQSYDMVDVVGSDAVGWFDLPHSSTYYEDLSAGGNYYAMLGALYDDCTAAAGGSVNLNDFVGINLMFNATFGPYAWGGGWGGWRVTWEPPWGWENIAVMGHEMGHGFGLPHSNNADGDGDPYDNPWDVMSNAWGYALNDGTYGTVGKHTISYHKDSLGWFTAERRAVIDTEGTTDHDIDHITLASTDNLHLVKVMIPGGNRFYTVEVRDREGYDGNLPGFAVIIHDVQPGRTEPAWLVDAENPSNGADAGAMWLPGECLDDPPNEIRICVSSVLTEGYRVRVFYGDWYVLFEDDFESGGTGAWSALGG